MTLGHGPFAMPPSTSSRAYSLMSDAASFDTSSPVAAAAIAACTSAGSCGSIHTRCGLKICTAATAAPFASRPICFRRPPPPSS